MVGQNSIQFPIILWCPGVGAGDIYMDPSMSSANVPSGRILNTSITVRGGLFVNLIVQIYKISDICLYA